MLFLVFTVCLKKYETLCAENGKQRVTALITRCCLLRELKTDILFTYRYV